MWYNTERFLNKVTSLLLFLSLFIFTTSSTAQSSIAGLEVTLQVENKKLTEVFKRLKETHNISFVYDRRHIPLNEPVSLSVENQPLEEVIQSLVAPFQLEFAIYGRQISIYRSTNQKFTISGYLKDLESDEALIGANIYERNTQKGTVSNQYGFFSLTLPSGKHEIVYSYLGYKERRDSIPLFSNIIRNVRLMAGNQLAEIVVVPRKEETTKEPPIKRFIAQPDAEELTVQEVKNYPALLGENDVLKTFTLLPGIQSGNEGDNGVSVRGGGRDQNLVLMDGAPIYNAYHLFGFVSLFNPEAVHKVQFYKSGFPSRYNGRLSSVMDIKLKDGNMKQFHGGVRIGLLASSFSLEGPIIKDKLSFTGSIRRPLLDLLVPNSIGNYSFIDNNFKLTWKLNERNRLHTSWYSGNDKFSFSNLNALFVGNSTDAFSNTIRNVSNSWGNKAAALNWSSIINPRLFSNVSINYSNYFNNSGDAISTFENEIDSIGPINYYRIDASSFKSQASVNVDFQYNLGVGKEFKFGGSYQLNYYDPLNLTKSTNDLTISSGVPSNYSNNAHFYLEADWNFTNRFRIRPGFHVALYSLGHTQETLPIIQPRFLFEYQFTPKSILNFNYSRMVQFDHYLSDSGLGFPTDLWVPSFKYSPETADQISLGYKHKLPLFFSVGISGYYKVLNNLLEYKPNASYYENGTSWFDFVEVGIGKSMGAEFTLARTKGRTTGWASYTLSSTQRQFVNINKGDWYPYRFDKRHDVAFAINHKLGPRVEMGAIWIFNTGNPVTLPIEQFTDYNGNTIYFAEERNKYRNPNTHRLDVSFNFHKLKVRTFRTWTLGCYNLYGRFNSYSTIFDGENFYHTSILRSPIPYATYKINF